LSLPILGWGERKKETHGVDFAGKTPKKKKFGCVSRFLGGGGKKKKGKKKPAYEKVGEKKRKEGADEKKGGEKKKERKGPGQWIDIVHVRLPRRAREGK